MKKYTNKYIKKRIKLGLDNDEIIETFNLSNVLIATPSDSAISANKICSVPTKFCPKSFPSWTAISNTRLALGVKGISDATNPVPRPIYNSISFWAKS